MHMAKRDVSNAVATRMWHNRRKLVSKLEVHNASHGQYDGNLSGVRKHDVTVASLDVAHEIDA